MKRKILKWFKELWYDITTPEHIQYEVALIEAWVECERKRVK